MKAARAAVLCLALFLAVGLATLIVFGKPELERAVVQRINSEATENLRLQTRGCSFSLRAFTLNGLTIYVKQGPLFSMIQFDTLEISPIWTSLFRRHAEFSITGQAYEGEIRGILGWRIPDGEGHARINIQGVHPHRQQQIAAAGITSGRLNLTAISTIERWSTFSETLLQLELSGMSKPSSTRAAIIPVSIPAFFDLNIAAECRLSPLAIDCTRIEEDSSLGTVSAVARIPSQGLAEQLKISADVALSPDGLTALGPYLPLVSNGRLTSDQGLFRVLATGTPAKPHLEVTGY